MRSGFICLLLLTILVNVQAQHNLSGSDRFSEYTYVYKIDPKEAKLMYIRGVDAFEDNEDRFLHTLIDSFRTGSPRPDLKPGNYLLVNAHEDNLNVQPYNTGDIHFKVLTNFYDLQLYLHNSAGQPISNAIVKVNKRKVGWDALSGVYRSSKVKKDALVEVMLDSVLHCFRLSKGQVSPKPILNFKGVFRKRTESGNHSWYRRYFDSKTKYESGFTGFMVFSKPVYKPGDTVKFKAWIMPSKGKPVNRPLLGMLVSLTWSIQWLAITHACMFAILHGDGAIHNHVTEAC